MTLDVSTKYNFSVPDLTPKIDPTGFANFNCASALNITVSKQYGASDDIDNWRALGIRSSHAHGQRLSVEFGSDDVQ